MSALAYAQKNNYDMLSKFESVKEFNNHFEQSMLLYKKYFTKSEYIALNNLRHYAGSEEMTGVAFCKIIKAVASTFEETEFGVSRRTHERMLVKAKTINLITIHHQERANGSQKHNVFVFNRLEELVAPPAKNAEIVSKSNTIDVANPCTIDAPISILLYLPEIKDLKINKTYQQADTAVQGADVIDFKKEKTPRDQLKHLVANLFNDDGKIANRMYGAWLAQTNKIVNKPSFDLAKQATMILINEVKRRYNDGLKPLNKPVGYFNNTLRKLIDRWADAELDRFLETYDVDADIDLVPGPDVAIDHNWLDENKVNHEALKGPEWLFW